MEQTVKKTKKQKQIYSNDGALISLHDKECSTLSGICSTGYSIPEQADLPPAFVKNQYPIYVSSICR